MLAAAVVSEQVPRRSGAQPVRRLLRRNVAVLFMLTVLAGAAGVAAIGVITSRVDRLTQHLEPLASANAAILQALTNAETGERGYVITGQAAFLAPYRAGRAAYPRAVARARQLSAGDPRDQAALAREVALGNSWLMGYATPSIHYVKTLHTAPISGALSLAAGKRDFDALRAANARFGAALRAEIKTADRNAHSDERDAVVTISLVTLLGLLIGTASSWWLSRQVAPPLQDLAGVLERQRGGERSLRATVSGASEVRAVAAAANELADAIDEAAAIRAYRDRLRSAVRELGLQLSEHLELETLLAEMPVRVAMALDLDLVAIVLDDGARRVGIWQANSLPGLAGRIGALGELLAPGATAPARVRLDDHALMSSIGPEALGVATALSAAELHELTVCPLGIDRATSGLLVLGRHGRLRPWNEESQDIATSLGADVERALANAALYERQGHLVRELQRLDRARDEFVSAVSHELRSPLTSIRGYLELLHDGDAGALNIEQATMVEVVQRNAVRLGGLIEDLLTVSRLEAKGARLRSDRVALNSLVSAVVEVILPQAERKALRLSVGHDENDPSVIGDRVALERVLLNLMSNAVKFTPPSGAVSIAVSSQDGRVRVRVSDTGIGIPAEDQPRLFERFFRAENAGRAGIAGTGLGLHIARSLAVQHGGELTLSSVEGEGSSFELDLPRAGAPGPSTL